MRLIAISFAVSAVTDIVFLYRGGGCKELPQDGFVSPAQSVIWNS